MSRFKRVRAALTSEAAPILISELLFNFGFFAVVPFIALSLSNDFGVGAAVIGLVLGLRTFGQRGMFLVGGALADRFGARSVILIGVVIRVAGFLSLTFSLVLAQPIFWLFVAGTFLTGLGGAFFGPGFQMIIAAADIKKPRRITLFAWLTVVSEVGSVLGPIAGSLLIDIPSEVNTFGLISGYASAMFALVGIVLWFVLPKGGGHGGLMTGPINLPTPEGAVRPRMRIRMPVKLPPGRFFAFATFHAFDGLAYNQLFLTIPLLLAKVGLDAKMLGLLFAWASILTLILQIPIARVGNIVGAPMALRLGHFTMASGFIVLALSGLTGADSNFLVIGGAFSFIVIGHLSANPAGLSMVPVIAKPKHRGVYFGALSSMVGVMVLLLNPVVGGLFEIQGMAGNVAPWVFLSIVGIIAGIGAPRSLVANLNAAARE